MKKKVNKLAEIEYKLEVVTEEEKLEAPSLTFDEYFQLLRKKDPKIQAHHKAPLRSYVARKGLKNEATQEEFDQVLKHY